MTVRELIDKLGEYDDYYDVFVRVPGKDPYTTSEFDIRRIDEGDLWSVDIYVE